MVTDWTQRIRLRHLKILISLAQTKNISLTAQRLNMTQPGISRWLKELEEDIGLPLFERHARGLRPTEHGRALAQHAQRIMANLDLSRADLKARLHEGSGLVNIGSTGAATAETVPIAILELLRTQPRIRVSVLEGTMDRLIQKLQAEELDIVIGRFNPALVTADIGHETLHMEPLQFIARPDHPLSAQANLSWADLKAYRWVIWPSNSPIRADLEKALIADQQSLPHDYIESNSTLLNITLLNNSDFLAVASARTAARLQLMNAVTIIELSLSGFGSVAVYWHKDAIKRPAVEQSLQALRNASTSYYERVHDQKAG